MSKICIQKYKIGVPGIPKQSEQEKLLATEFNDLIWIPFAADS